MKIRSKFALVLTLFVLLAACQPVATALPSQPAPPTAAAPTAPPAPLPTSTEPPPAASPTPAASLAPTNTPFQPATPTAGSPQPQAFTDCALLPALAACKGPALPLSGMLALNDPANKRLVLANFQGGTAWQAALDGVLQLSFSPSGKLLGALEPGAPISVAVTLDTSSGKQEQELNAPAWPGWTPQDGLNSSQFRTAWSSGGDEAWIDFQKAELHVRFAAHPDQEVTWPVEAAPSDKVHQVIAWVPGSEWLLAEYHFGGSSMWITGGELYAINAKTGKILDLKAHMKLDFQFQWHPSEMGVMVFGESSNSPVMGGQRLAVLNVLTGALTYLIADRNVSVTSPNWLPDGKRVLFGVRTPGANPYNASAVYTVGRDGKGAAALTKPPAGQYDDAPQALPDGKDFLYFRVDQAAQTGVLRVASLDGALDQPVTGALPAPQCVIGPYCSWDSVAVYRP